MRRREAQADEVEMRECAEPCSGRVGDFEQSEGGKSVQPGAAPLIRDKKPEAKRTATDTATATGTVTATATIYGHPYPRVTTMVKLFY
jgi:hypothetical protein